MTRLLFGGQASEKRHICLRSNESGLCFANQLSDSKRNQTQKSHAARIIKTRSNQPNQRQIEHTCEAISTSSVCTYGSTFSLPRWCGTRLGNQNAQPTAEA